MERRPDICRKHRICVICEGFEDYHYDWIEKINKYLQEALTELRHVLSDLSDAEFNYYTSPYQDEE